MCKEKRGYSKKKKRRQDKTNNKYKEKWKIYRKTLIDIMQSSSVFI